MGELYCRTGHEPRTHKRVKSSTRHCCRHVIRERCEGSHGSTSLRESETRSKTESNAGGEGHRERGRGREMRFPESMNAGCDIRKCIVGVDEWVTVHEAAIEIIRRDGCKRAWGE